jgi:hypothetical protein
MYHYFCAFTEDDSTYQEIRHKIFGWGFFLFVGMMIVGVFASLIIGGIYGLNIGNNMLATYSFVMSTAFIIPCVQLIVFFVNYFRKKGTANQINAHFYDECISVNDSLKIAYTDVKKVTQTSNYIILYVNEPNKPHKYLPIKKDALNCNPETLICFLKEKRKENRTKYFLPAH